jgi:predicted  nucleic acid-binding Zn-ribbon protein
MTTDHPSESLEERIADLRDKRERLSRAIDGLDPTADLMLYARATGLLSTIDGRIAGLEKRLMELEKGVEEKLRDIEEALETFWETVEGLS